MSVVAFSVKLSSILQSMLNRNQSQGSRVFSKQVDAIRWFPIAFPTNGGVSVVTLSGFELTTPTFSLYTLNQLLVRQQSYLRGTFET